MKNPYSIIALIIAMAFIFGSGIFKGFFFPVLILFFAFQYSNRKSKKQPSETDPFDWRGFDPQHRRRGTDYNRPGRYQRPPVVQKQKPVLSPKKRPNPFKKSGVAKYKEFDYEGAIEDFKKALDIDPNDIPTLFNIACAYSLTEDKEKAFFYLDKAVEKGFKDFKKIQTHDAFAFIRIQDEFVEFANQGYRLSEEKKQAAADKAQPGTDLFEKLKKLAELRESGILTEEEFLIQKEKLLG